MVCTKRNRSRLFLSYFALQAVSAAAAAAAASLFSVCSWTFAYNGNEVSKRCAKSDKVS